MKICVWYETGGVGDEYCKTDSLADIIYLFTL